MNEKHFIERSAIKISVTSLIFVFLFSGTSLFVPQAYGISTRPDANSKFYSPHLQVIYVSPFHYNSNLTCWLENSYGQITTSFYEGDEVWLFVATNHSNTYLSILENYPYPPSTYSLISEISLPNSGSYRIGPFIPGSHDSEGYYLWNVTLKDSSSHLIGYQELQFYYHNYYLEEGELTIINAPSPMWVNKGYTVEVNVRNLMYFSKVFIVYFSGNGFTTSTPSQTISLPPYSDTTLSFSVTPTVTGSIPITFKLYSYSRLIDTETVTVNVKSLKPGPISLWYSFPSTVKYGEDFNLYVTLTNDGESTAKNLYLEITAAPGFEAPYPIAKIVNLDPGDKESVAFHLKAVETGYHLIQIRVSYYDELGNSYVNYLQITLEVEYSLQGNLNVIDYPKEMIKGKSYQIGIEIENPSETSGNFLLKVSAADFNSSISTETYSIPPKGKKTIYLKLTPLKEGHKTVHFTLTYGDKTTTQTVEIDVLSAHGYFTISELPSEMALGSEGKVTVVVTNDGGIETEFNVSLSSPDFEITPNQKKATLKPDEATALSFHIRPKGGGEKKLSIVLSYLGQQTRKEAKILVYEAKAEFVEINSPQTLKLNSPGIINLTVRNTGETKSSFTVTLDSVNFSINPHQRDIEIEPGEQATYLFSVIPEKEGYQTLNAQLSNQGLVLDSATVKILVPPTFTIFPLLGLESRDLVIAALVGLDVLILALLVFIGRRKI